MLLLPFAFTILVAACDMCDALDTGVKAHPFAISATWVPKCGAAQQRFVTSDPWPKAGETRRDGFTRDCADILLARVFAAADGGMTEDELFVSARVERKRGRDVMVARRHEFIGVMGSHSYRYSFTLSPEGGLLRGVGSVEAAKITSHLVGTVLAPEVRPKALAAQTVTCEGWQERCELMSRPVGSDVALPFFVVRFDDVHPGGNLCVEAGAPATLIADGRAVVDRVEATPGTSIACLGPRSGEVLAALARARAVSYRAGADKAVALDVTGLDAALKLGAFLAENTVTRRTRLDLARQLGAAGDAFLDAAAKSD